MSLGESCIFATSNYRLRLWDGGESITTLYDLNRTNAFFISKLRVVYDVFGMGKNVILRYNK